MGKRGAAPKPTNLRILHGEKRYRINRDEVKPPVQSPTCPEHPIRRGQAGMGMPSSGPPPQAAAHNLGFRCVRGLLRGGHPAPTRV
jgi:hypothetical protein